MAKYAFLGGYKAETWAHLVANPGDRQAAIQKAAERGRRQDGDGFGVKLGIHVGEVLVGKTSGGPQIDAEERRQQWTALDRMLEGLRP